MIGARSPAISSPLDYYRARGALLTHNLPGEVLSSPRRGRSASRGRRRSAVGTQSVPYGSMGPAYNGSNPCPLRYGLSPQKNQYARSKSRLKAFS